VTRFRDAGIAELIGMWRREDRLPLLERAVATIASLRMREAIARSRRGLRFGFAKAGLSSPPEYWTTCAG